MKNKPKFKIGNFVIIKQKIELVSINGTSYHSNFLGKVTSCELCKYNSNQSYNGYKYDVEFMIDNEKFYGNFLEWYLIRTNSCTIKQKLGIK